jgi:YjbE family integral membrane protein
MDVFDLHGVTIALQILVVDLLLGADNALLIGLASRALSPRDRKRAVALGVVGAVVLRLLMIVIATTLLTLPLVKLIGAVLLMIIALNLAENGSDGQEASDDKSGNLSRLWAAAALIVVADAVMSIDNVVALAAIAQGDYVWLLIGVALSLPMLGYGGLVVAQALHRAPGLVAFGAALLGWIAGGMAVSDALWAHWTQTSAPGLATFAPILGAAFVFLHGRLVARSAPAPERAIRPPAVRPARAAAPTSTVSPARRAAAAAAAIDLRQRAEPNAAPSVETRVMLVGMVLLALIGGSLLVFASYYGGY